MVENKEREERIAMEIIVDTYDSQECAMGWYCYLEDNLAFPFKAHLAEPNLPLEKCAVATVIGMDSQSDCLGGMFVECEDDELAFSYELENIYPIDKTAALAKTNEAIEDWRYWIGRGYRF